MQSEGCEFLLQFVHASRFAQGSLRGLRVITTVGEPLTSQLANRVAGSLPDGSGDFL